MDRLKKEKEELEKMDIVQRAIILWTKWKIWGYINYKSMLAETLEQLTAEQYQQLPEEMKKWYSSDRYWIEFVGRCPKCWSWLKKRRYDYIGEVGIEIYCPCGGYGHSYD